MNNLARRLSERGLLLEVTDTAKQALAAEGYDPQFGARPLKRVIQQRIENALATRILAGEFKPGDLIVIDYERGAFIFRRGAMEEAAEHEVEAEVGE